MKKRSGSAVAALSLAAVLLPPLFTGVGTPAYAQSAALALCDRVAADPTDPDKPADVKGTDTIAPGDIATAIKFCKVAAGASRRAMYELGRAFAANRQLPEAAGAYRKAADKGSTAAMVELGVLFADGAGVAQDQAQARALFQRAAAAGNPRGATNLAALAGGGGAASDPAEARALLQQAAASNSAEAEFELGVMLADGTGGPKDDAGARALFVKAAAQNHAAALEWLGAFEEAGRGGPTDKAAAKADYERAVALGDNNAKAGLERLKCPLVLSTKKGDVWTHLCF
ncbi:MAG TPA: tetratricopeptide repeat protein [Xanthobacteraceae bacterium]|nr:tetratricopeptide repeat protein [Xanthobacteraceae bacterium]